jgi:hypothetical protein
MVMSNFLVQNLDDEDDVTYNDIRAESMPCSRSVVVTTSENLLDLTPNGSHEVEERMRMFLHSSFRGGGGKDSIENVKLDF